MILVALSEKQVGTPILVKVTKEVLRRSMYCNNITEDPTKGAPTNCAIALAIRDLFPHAAVTRSGIYTKSTVQGDKLVVDYNCHIIELPIIADVFITYFDRCTPSQRVQLPELEFEIIVPDEALEDVMSKDELKKLLEHHPTMQMV